MASTLIGAASNAMSAGKQVATLLGYKEPVKPKSSPSLTGSKGSWTWNQKGQYANNGDAFRHQRLPFMFEVEQDGWTMVLPVNPENYRQTFKPRASITMTQSGLFEDNIGNAPPQFALSGVFGVYNDSKVLNEHRGITGPQAYHELERNMMYFYERFGAYYLDRNQNGQPVNPANQPTLNFYNFGDMQFWVVQVNAFTLLRNTQRKHLFQYDIQMTGLQRIQGKKPPVIDSTQTAANPIKELLGKVDQWNNAIQGTLTAGAAAAKSLSTIKSQMTMLKNTLPSLPSLK